jgi:hypothetical protein
MFDAEIASTLLNRRAGQAPNEEHDVGAPDSETVWTRCTAQQPLQ